MRRLKVPARLVIREQRETIREQEMLIEWLLERIQKQDAVSQTPKETDDGHA